MAHTKTSKMRPTKQRMDLTAIIYDRRGRILSIGKNSYVKTHPLQAKLAKDVGLTEKVFLHAEISAIVRCKDLSKAYRIVVMRFSKAGEPVMAKPCAICKKAIEDLTPIREIGYTGMDLSWSHHHD